MCRHGQSIPQYGKGLAFQDGYKTAWEIMAKDNPDALAGSTNKYQNWEVVDPEKWVPDGYVCVRIDSRGCRIALSIRGRDYEYGGEAATLSNMKNPMCGCGLFVRDDPTDRPPAIFGGKVTPHFGPGRQASVLLPVIPPIQD